jgi:hypothetical protein
MNRVVSLAATPGYAGVGHGRIELMDLHFDTVWNDLIENWKYSPRYVAVPYFSCDNDLTFDAGDVLIVDANIPCGRMGTLVKK